MQMKEREAMMKKMAKIFALILAISILLEDSAVVFAMETQESESFEEEAEETENENVEGGTQYFLDENYTVEVGNSVAVSVMMELPNGYDSGKWICSSGDEVSFDADSTNSDSAYGITYSETDSQSPEITEEDNMWLFSVEIYGVVAGEYTLTASVESGSEEYTVSTSLCVKKYEKEDGQEKDYFNIGELEKYDSETKDVKWYTRDFDNSWYYSEQEKKDEIVYSGFCGKNASFTLYKDGTLVISGTGAMDDYTKSQESEQPYALNNVKYIVIEEGITRIGDYAFGETDPWASPSGKNWCDNIQTVQIADSVTEIGRCAFWGCADLDTVSLGSGVQKIGEYAFSYCTSLEGFIVDENNPYFVTEEDVLFSSDKKTLVCYPRMSSSCYFVPDGVISIENDAFGCNYFLEEVILPSSISIIGECAFDECINLKKVKFVDNKASNYALIADSAFSNCTSLENITIPKFFTSIEGDIFYGVSKEQLIINCVKDSCAYCYAVENQYQYSLFVDNSKNDKDPDFDCILINEKNFPDENFRKIILNMSYGWDAVLVPYEISKMIYLDVSFSNIKSLEGIEYFSCLKELDCEGNQLTELPDLPNTLEGLDCESNQLTELPELPSTLAVLDCSQNQIEQLPKLPEKLNNLSCGENVITSLPVLPKSLETLECIRNRITNLPDLPETLIELECNANEIRKLPKLPQKLTNLQCSSCELSDIPELPKSLEYLSCVNNHLTKLPELPDKLQILQCENNKLSELPKLPANMKQLSCSHNYLSAVELNEEANYDYIDLRYNIIENQNKITGNDGIAWDEKAQWGSIPFEFSPQRNVKISSIKVKKLPYKIEYDLGEELDLSGLIVEATYSDGDKVDIDNYTVSGYQSDKIGTQKIVISCGDCSTEIEVEVFDAKSKDDAIAEIKKSENHRIYTDAQSSAVITDNGDLYSWGKNLYGAVGNGSTERQMVPVKILSDVVDVQSGNFYSAALTKSKDLYFWGYNTYGQIGNGTTYHQKSPVKILSNVQSFSLKSLHSAAITENGDLYVWGYNPFGQVGTGEQANYEATPVKVLSDVAYVTVGDTTTAAITKSGDLYIWGCGWSGQIGNGSFDIQPAPVKILSDVVSVDLGSTHSAAITKNGDLYLWGNGENGRLGTGETANACEPVKILSNVREVVLNDDISAAITQNDNLYLWGKNFLSGSIGNGTYDDQYTPYKTLSNVKKVCLTGSLVAAITNDGELYTWGGDNENGQIGNGTKKEQIQPVKVFPNVEEVSVTATRIGAISKEGVYFWGYNGDGGIGDGTTTDRSTPTKIMETKVFNEFEIEEILPQEYTGEPIKPIPVITDKGVALQYGTDYTLSYKNNSKVGKGQIVIVGKGNYTKNITTEFEIVAKSLSDEDITIACADKLYNGKKQTSNPVVKWGKKVLKSGVDYTVEYSDDQISAGEVRVTIRGKGNYTGVAETTYRITDKDISKTVMDNITAQSYTGEAIEPEIVLYANKSEQKKGNPLELNKDYQVSYENNVFAGKGKITVTGVGEYGGTKSVTFTISKCAISSDNIDISFVNDDNEEEYCVSYTGKAQKPELMIKAGEKILEAGKDYSLSYSNNTIVAGTASKKKPTVTVQGLGNYSGTDKVYFNILPQDISMTENLEVIVADARYTGKAVKPSVTLKANGKTLKNGTDYKIISYGNNVELCEKSAENGAYVRIEGIKNYTGMIQENFRIYSGNASGFIVDKISAQEYTPHQKIEPEVVVYANKNDKKDGVALLQGTDYEVDYEKNEKVGTAKVIIHGIGEYGGTKTVNFTISKRKFITQDSLSQVHMEIQSDHMTYTGNALKPEVKVFEDGSVELVEGVDYTISYSNNKNVSTNSKKQPTITVKGKGNYAGTISQKFVIEPKNIGAEGIEAMVNDVLFNQKKANSKSGITTTVTVKDGTKKLSSSDYKISQYMNNKAVGDLDDENAPTVVLEGKGNYTGTIEIPFRIYKTAISSATVTKISSVLYSGEPMEPKPEVTVKISKNHTITLIEGKDYTVQWENNVKIGKGKVIISGIGEYGGTKTATFTILPRWLKWFQ